MSTNNKGKPTGAEPAPSRKPMGRGMMILGVLVAGLVVALGLWWFGRERPEVVSLSAPQGDEVTAAEFEKIRGKWVRPDGGYVLEIKQRLPGDGLEAGYFNPNPIKVAKARLSKEGRSVKVSVEFDDVNYTGSTYTLIYDAGNDQLIGVYHQAMQGMDYQIFFTRM